MSGGISIFAGEMRWRRGGIGPDTLKQLLLLVVVAAANIVGAAEYVVSMNSDIMIA